MIIMNNDHKTIFKFINLFIFEGAIRPFTRSYFFGLTQKVTKKVKASSSPFLLEQEFFSFAVLRPDVSGRRVAGSLLCVIPPPKSLSNL
jgi:hypothetical protein